MSGVDNNSVKDWLLSLQQRIVSAAEAIDGKQFIRDAWERPEGGGGISRLIEEGNVLERWQIALSWRVARGRRWVCRWFSIHVIRMHRQCT